MTPEQILAEAFAHQWDVPPEHVKGDVTCALEALDVAGFFPCTEGQGVVNSEVVHSLRQPLLGLNGEMLILRRLAKRDDVPPEVRDKLTEISEAAAAYVQRAEELLARLADLKLPSFEEVLPENLVDGAVADASDAIERYRTSLAAADQIHNELLTHAAAAQTVIDAARTSLQVFDELGVVHRADAVKQLRAALAAYDSGARPEEDA